MKKIALLLTTAVLSTHTYAQIYMAKTCEISFFSATPVENITAINKTTKPFLQTATGEIQMKIGMTAFVFEKPLMQEHFNENYVESEKFPHAFFKGKINEKIDYTENGTYKVTVTGKMTIHGVEKEKTISGIVVVDKNKITISATFKLDFTEFGIVIPSLQAGIIPPDTEVKINAVLEPFVAPPKAKIGMTKDEVIKVMGKPEDISETETKQGKTEILFYNKLKITINIDVNGKVDYINNIK